MTRPECAAVVWRISGWVWNSPTPSSVRWRVELAGLLGAADRVSVNFMTADEQASPDQTLALRRMSPAERWRVAHRLYWTMRRHKTAFLRAQHPDWSEQRVVERVRHIFLHAGA